MSDIKPTEEQIHAITTAHYGETFVLDACAGSGKTTTARKMCQAIDGRVLYLVYNKSAAMDARASFPNGVKVSTTSALAWHRYPEYQDRMNPQARRVKAKDTAILAGLTQPVQLGANTAMSPVTVASWALETIQKFCYSSAVKITEKHTPPILAFGLEALQEDLLRSEIVIWARKIWADAIKPGNKHRFTMDYAFKLMVMSPPDLGYDAVIIDEAQDSNYATLHLLKAQINSQLVAIGDPAQQLYCQPLGTQVEVVTKRSTGIDRAESARQNIEDLKVGDHVVTYDNTHLWRHGRKITHISRFRHEGEMVTATTSTGLSSTYTPKHHCIVRIDDNLSDKHVVYLMRRGDQYRIGRTRMMYSSQHKGFGVVLRGRREKADGVWILSTHDTLGEASLAEMLTQHTHNIPGVHFEPADNDAADIRLFWEKIGNNKENGERCLKDFGRLSEFPLWHPVMDQKMGIRTAFPTAAANLMNGMTVLPLRNVDRQDKGKAPRRVWEEIAVSRTVYHGDVVSLEVDGHHNYFGDGILTHNSWRGATDIMGEFGGERLALSQSFRFGNRIAEEADKWLAHTRTNIRVRGNPAMDSIVVSRPLSPTNAVLCRSNATVMSRAIEFLDDGKKVAIVGGTQKLRDMAFAARDLMSGKRTSYAELAAFADWGELMAFTEEPGGGDLKALVQLINQYKVNGILDACNRLVPENYDEAKIQRRTFVPPDVVISTAHKAKGREWSNVEIATDFKEPDDVNDPETGIAEPGPIGRSEAMLHYVTVTRARHQLNRIGLEWIDRHPAVDKLSKAG